MKRLLCLFLFFCWAAASASTGFTKIQDNGPDSNRVVIVYIAEGFTVAEQAKFDSLVDSINAKFFEFEPYRTYRKAFNVYRLNTISKESGTDIGATVRDTRFNSKIYDHGRYSTITFDGSGIRDTLEDLGVMWDASTMLINYDYSGGSADISSGIAAIPLQTNLHFSVAHEFGHTFGGLSDEYVLSGSPYPDKSDEPNVAFPPDTAASGPHAVKWSAWLTPGVPIPTPAGYPYDKSVGVFDGAKYAFGCYRPEIDCMMNTSQGPYCRICTEALTLQIHNHCYMATRQNPTGQILYYNWYPVTASINVMDAKQAGGNIGYKIEWYFDYAPLQGEHGTATTLSPSMLGQEPHVLWAIVTDTSRYDYKVGLPIPKLVENTRFIRNDPRGLATDTVVWYVQFKYDSEIMLAEQGATNSGERIAFSILGRQIAFSGEGLGVSKNQCIRIYDTRGRLLQTLANGRVWNAPSAGMYVIRLDGRQHQQTKRLVIR